MGQTAAETPSVVPGLDPGALFRAIAVPASTQLPGSSNVAFTPVGAVRFAIRGLGEPLPTTRAGVGLATPPSGLERSRASALLALRLTSRREPVVHADRLGGVLLIAEAADAAPHDHADLAALKFLLRAQPNALAVLEVLAATANLTAVSAETGLHIETVRERSRDYVRALGFDILNPRGRSRLGVALALFRLQTNRFT